MSQLLNIEQVQERQRADDALRTQTLHQQSSPPTRMCGCGTMCWPTCDGDVVLYHCPTCGHGWCIWNERLLTVERAS